MRMPVRIALVLGCLTVTGAVLIVIAGPGSRADTGPDLMTLIRSESPLPESVRREADIDTARLAQENTEFRHWLVGVVASDDVPMKTREAAMQALWHLEGDDVIRDLAASLTPWMQEPWSPTPGRRLRGGVFTEVFYNMLLKTDVPADEILRSLEKANPYWRAGSEAYLRYEPRVWSTGSAEEDRKRTERFAAVLALARSRDEASLMARVQSEAPLPARQEPAFAELPGLAETDPAFRKWLAGVATFAEDDHWVRGLALKALLDMESDDAVRGLVNDMRPWLRDRDAMGTGYHRQVADLLFDRLLLTNLPVEDVLQLARGTLQSWDTRALALASGYPPESAAWTEEQEGRLRDRAMAAVEAQGGELLAETRRWIARRKKSREGAAPGPRQQRAVAADGE